MKRFKLITALLIITGALYSCDETKKKDTTHDVEQHIEIVNKKNDLKAKTDTIKTPAYCLNQVYKSPSNNTNSYDANGNYLLTFNLPSDDVMINGVSTKVEPKFVKSFSIQEGASPIVMELWQHGLEHKKSLCNLKPKLQTSLGKFKGVTSTGRRDGHVIIYHDEDWFDYTDNDRKSIINEIKNEVNTRNKGLTHLSHSELIEIVKRKAKPQTIGGGVIPPK